MTQAQLPLNLGLADSALFASFVTGANSEVVDYLQDLQNTAVTPWTYLWGASGTGKSHLLQAVCHAAGARRQAAVYLPLKIIKDDVPPAALDGLETMAVICIDDVHEIAGRAAWEQALFGLLIRMDPNHSRMLMTGRTLPAGLGLQLSDLVSRLNGGLIFPLRPADAEVKLNALLLRARRRGLIIPDRVGRYLVNRFGAEMTVLFDALETLDRASLAAQRKVTIPFIREVLGSGE
jgi:DnaA family protein